MDSVSLIYREHLTGVVSRSLITGYPGTGTDARRKIKKLSTY